MFYVTKRELSAIPFDEIHRVVSSAGNAVKNALLVEAKDVHDANVRRKITAIYANREDSYEGNEDEDFPFIPPDQEYIEEQVSLAKKEAFAKMAEKYDFKSNGGWLLPQLTAYIAKMPLPRTEEGKIDSYAYFKSFGENDFLKGIYTFCTHPVRGDIVFKQYAPEFKNYSALIPLLMMPHKKFNGIQYNEWDLKGLYKVVDSQLYSAMVCEFDTSEITTNELLSMRQAGMQYKTGKTAGTFRNPATSHKVYGLQAPFNKIPWLAQVMLFQIWIAHPTNRTNMMILDWKDWDNMPNPLIDSCVGLEEKPKRWTPPTSTGDDWE